MKQKSRSLRQVAFICLTLVISSMALAQETEKKDDSNKEYAGQYTFDNKSDFGFDVTVTYDADNGLQAEPTDKSQPKADLMALGKDEFELLKTGGLIATFKRDENGKVVSVTLSAGDRSFTCIKK